MFFAFVCSIEKNFAETLDRTGDLQIFSLTLSQLCYRGTGCSMRSRSLFATTHHNHGRKLTPPHCCPMQKGCGANWRRHAEDEMLKRKLAQMLVVNMLNKSKQFCAPYVLLITLYIVFCFKLEAPCKLTNRKLRGRELNPGLPRDRRKY